MIVSTLHSKFKTPKYDKWKSAQESQSDISKDCYIGSHIHMELFALLGKVLYPDFCEVEGLIIIEDWADVAKQDFPKRQIENINEWQLSLNRFIVRDFFSASADQVDDDIYEAILEILKLSWSSALKKSFPKRNFIFEILNDEIEEPSISFCDVIVNHDQRTTKKGNYPKSSF